MTTSGYIEPKFRIIQSNQLDCLADRLILDFANAATVRHPLAPCTFVVQSLGMQKWLSYKLAKSLGIAAAVDYDLPARLIWRLVNMLQPYRAEAESLYTKERMHLTLYKLLANTEAKWLNDDSAAPVRVFLGLNQMPADDANDTLLKRYRFAGWVADLFDQYLIYRPDWMLHWRGEKSPTPDNQLSAATSSQPWQPLLWKELVEATNQAPDRAMLQQQAFQRLSSDEPFGDLLSEVLGPRLTLFGISALPPAQLAFLVAISNHLPVDCYLSNPCQEFWADIVSPKHQATITAKSHSSETSSDISHYYTTGHPLLGSLGRSGRDFIDQLLEISDNYDLTDAFTVPSGNSLLHRLQRDILHLSQPAVGSGKKPDSSTDPKLDANDHSIRLVSCYGPMREVEVLHDWLLNCMDQQPELTPEDVVVMVPDINTYRPYIDAVFGLNSEPCAIPYSISDHQREAGADVVDTLKALLRLPESRLGASEINALLELPAIQRKFNLSHADAARIGFLIEAAGIRWGADKEHWRLVGAPEVEQELHYPYSWAYGLERTMLSYCLGDYDVEFAGLKPFAGPSSATDPAATGLFGLVKQLLHYREELSKPHTITEWVPILRELGAAFFELAATELVALSSYHIEISRMNRMANELQLNDKVPLSLMREMLNLDATTISNQHRYLVGGVTFCTLMPMRNIPFKIIALIGMNETDFPRAATKLSFDLLETYHRKGDRDTRSEAFYMFLEAILSAQDQLYISWGGLDARNNQVRPPSVVVTLLLSTIKRYYGDPKQLTIQHPLQPFSSKYGNNEPWYTYATHWVLPDTEGNQLAPSSNRPSQPAPKPDANAVDATTLALETLVAFYREPACHYLQQHHRLYQPPKLMMLDDEEPMELNNLDRFKLRNLGLALIFEPKGIAHWRRQASKDQSVPVSAIGKLALDDLEAQLMKYQAFANGNNGEMPGKINIDLKCAGLRIQGEMDGILSDKRIVLLAGTAGAKNWLPFWISHLVLGANGSNLPSCMMDNSISMKAKPNPLTLPAIPKDEAQELLADYLIAMQLYMAADVSNPQPLLIASGHAWASNFHKTNPKSDADESLKLSNPLHIDLAKQAWLGGSHESSRFSAEYQSWYNQILWTDFPGETQPEAFCAMSRRIWSKFVETTSSRKKSSSGRKS